jgi:hypothetical protein
MSTAPSTAVATESTAPVAVPGVTKLVVNAAATKLSTSMANAEAALKAATASAQALSQTHGIVTLPTTATTHASSSQTESDPPLTQEQTSGINTRLRDLLCRKRTSTEYVQFLRYGARFSAEIYTRGCHWIPTHVRLKRTRV